jgi:hypothetical protein
MSRTLRTEYKDKICEAIDFSKFKDFHHIVFYHILDDKLVIGKITKFIINDLPQFEGFIEVSQNNGIKHTPITLDYDNLCVINNEYFETDCNILDPECGADAIGKLGILFNKLIIQ